jgi:hypothetical protein
MADLTLPIIGLTALVGWLFSKDGENPRSKPSIRQAVKALEKPNGSDIYQSKQLDIVNAEVLQKSLTNYKKAENPESTGVLPPIINTFGAVGKNVIFASDQNPELNTEDVYQKAYIDARLKDASAAVKQTQPPVEDRPMFADKISPMSQIDDVLYMGVEKDANTPDVSLLTGLPIDNTHHNMTPFFGGSVRQSIETFANESLLDAKTGNTSTFFRKKETAPLFGNTPQDIHGTPIFTDNVDLSRYVPSLYKQNEKPFDDIKVPAPIAGTIDNNIRPNYKTVDELRVASKPKTTYDGRTIAGQMGSTRGVQGAFYKQRPDTFYETQGTDNWFKTTGDFIAPVTQQNYDNFKDTSRQTSQSEYFGTAQSTNAKTIQRATTETSEFDSLVQQSKKNSFANDYLRNAGGSVGVTDYGRNGIANYETERATTGEYTNQSNVSLPTAGMRTQLMDSAKTTLKEGTLVADSSGHIASAFNRGNAEAYQLGVAGIDAKPTLKQSAILNSYKGGISKDGGMGYTVTTYTAKTTGKETTLTSYDGNPGFATENTSRDNYANAEIRDIKENALVGARPSGPQWFSTAGGKDSYGDVKFTGNMALKEAEDGRDNYNVSVSSAIPSRNGFGIETKVRFDDERKDTVFADRMEPDLIISQHNQNPYSLMKRL